ncbi:MAG: hypothetical protein KAH17_08810 [Bacteroidales bacterium]|nr:hypothetical protein [Bacteroidales bacterium]
MKKILFAFLILLLVTYPSLSQSFGAFSPGIKWKQINTKSVRVIFPESLEAQANRVANMVLYIDRNNHLTIGEQSKKIDLVLNNQGVIPNGYVALSPYRSEFFTTPFQKSEVLGSLPWLDLLSVHEYRHALQYANFKKGITKIGYILFGETFWSLALNLTTPNWYFEGDAVMTETALTEQGRGRIPTFLQDYQSILNSDSYYSYDKARNGSYRHNVPDHYRLGYMLCSYGREEYGDSLWMDIMDQTARFKGIIYPFSKALKRTTGLNSKKFYAEAFDYYSELWGGNKIDSSFDQSTTINKKFRTITNYQYPIYDPHGNQWLAVKSSYKKTSAIYEIHENGKESKVVEIGINLDTYFSASNDYFVWSELSSDKRFSSISFSDIVIYDRITKRKRYLTKNCRYFSPAISPNQTEILVLTAKPNGEYMLEILDRVSGETKKTIPNPDNYYFTYPQWSKDGSLIFSTARKTDGRMCIVAVDPATGAIKFLINPLNHILGKLTAGKDHIYFSSSFNGKDNIYSLDIKTNEIVQLSNSPYGAYHPAVNPKEDLLCYSAYYHSGKELETIPISYDGYKTTNLTGLDQLIGNQPKYAKFEGGSILSDIPKEKFKVKGYRPAFNSLKFHSWSPVVSTSTVGLGLVSDNVLNNLHFEAGYKYYLNEASSGFSVAAIYGQYLPIFSLGYNQGFRNPGFNISDNLKVWERNISAGVNIPLDFSKGMFHRNIIGGLNLQHTAVPALAGISNLGGGKVNFTTVGFQSKFVITKIQAYQNITTPLGIGGELMFNRSISSLKASQLQLYLDGAVRGLLPNHNVVLGFSYMKESMWNPYQYIDLNTYPRGYAIPACNWLATWQLNYHFPLIYPDIGFGGLVYLMRIRANLFADYAFGNTLNPSSGYEQSQSFQSIGGELIFDMRIIRLVPMSLGFRLSALGQTDLLNPGRSSYFEVFFPVFRL